MRAPSSARFPWIAALCAVVSVVSADVGGGRGHPATPWRIAGPKNATELEKAKEAAAKCQALFLPGALFETAGDEPEKIDDVALRALPARADETGVYALKGKDAAGKKVSVSFSDIESFVVTSRSDTALKLTVTIWPDISAKDLIKKQPTYKQLQEGFRREVVLEIPFKSADGREQELAGDFGPKLPLAKLGVGTRGDFYGGDPHMVNPRRFWWAIPSVNKDPDYPYRLIPKS